MALKTYYSVTDDDIAAIALGNLNVTISHTLSDEIIRSAIRYQQSIYNKDNIKLVTHIIRNNSSAVHDILDAEMTEKGFVIFRTVDQMLPFSIYYNDNFTYKDINNMPNSGHYMMMIGRDKDYYYLVDQLSEINMNVAEHPSNRKDIIRYPKNKMNDFTMSNDDVVVVEGENGSGKSTFIKILIGAINFQEGQMVIDHKHIIMSNNKAEIIYNYFYIPQDDILLDINTDNLIMNIAKEKYKVCIEYILSMGLLYNQIKCQQFSDLSVGERKKILISLAFVHDNRFIIMDEPTNHLDKIGKQALRKMITERNKQIILITHEKTLFVDFGINKWEAAPRNFPFFCVLLQLLASASTLRAIGNIAISTAGVSI